MEYTYINKNTLFCMKYKTDSNFKMDTSHFHNNIYELFVILDGTRKLITKDCLFEFGPQSVFLIKPGAQHRFIEGEFSKFSSLYMEFPKQWLSPHLAQYPAKNTDVYLITPSKEDMNIIKDTISDFVDCYKAAAEGYEYEIYSLALKVMSIVLRYDNEAVYDVQKGRNYDRVYHIIEYINENYDKELKLSLIADKFYINEHYMCHMFKKCTGRSIGSYITEIRLANAANMLEHTTYDVKTIGKKCGYKSLSHFNHAFKNHTGITPLKYRKQKQ